MDTCLDFEQLQRYSQRLAPKAEMNALYRHISGCELCACAVNGFSVLPFTSDDLVAIHREIDVKCGARKIPFSAGRVLIASVSLAMIALVYHLPAIISKPSESTISPVLPQKVVPQIILPSNEKKNELQSEVSFVASQAKKTLKTYQQKKFERKLEHVDEFVPRPAQIQLISVSPSEAANEPMLPHFSANVIYIYDLKVADYNSLYFGAHHSGSSDLSHTPVYRENPESPQPDLGPDLAELPSDRVLKEGLLLFTKGDYKAAMKNFDFLLANNSDDINAAFYSGICAFNLARYDRTIELLETAAGAGNSAFRQEALWFSALASLRKGDRSAGVRLLRQIVEEKGFYSKRAAEKLLAL
jgi:hypothetical protein